MSIFASNAVKQTHERTILPYNGAVCQPPKPFSSFLFQIRSHLCSHRRLPRPHRPLRELWRAPPHIAPHTLPPATTHGCVRPLNGVEREAGDKQIPQRAVPATRSGAKERLPVVLLLHGQQSLCPSLDIATAAQEATQVVVALGAGYGGLGPCQISLAGRAGAEHYKSSY